MDGSAFKDAKPRPDGRSAVRVSWSTNEETSSSVGRILCEVPVYWLRFGVLFMRVHYFLVADCDIWDLGGGIADRGL